MIFNSYLFVFVFLPVTILIYYLINKGGHFEAAKIFLLVMSVLFYCSDNANTFLIIVAGIIVNYCIATYCFVKGLNETIRKIILALSVILNLSSLIYFKYLGFFSDIINSIFKTGLSYKAVLLPLGISYYTFSQIAYLVDSYKDMETKYGFLDYSLFVTFFPKISVGPIALAKDLIPQFTDNLRKKADFDNIAKGMVIFAVGLSKKVLLADNLAPYVTWGYLNLDSMGTVNAIVVMLAYTMQIYFDFSGYCDMAKAICLMLNIDLCDNFLSPYRALSISEFWKRWHLSLTNFFTRYVYIPLGGNRKGKIRTYINMFIIFFLSGLWHGASYTFIVWGIIHGIGISLSKATSRFMVKLPDALRRFGTFIFVSVTWIFFRSSTIDEALRFLKQLVSFDFSTVHVQLIADATMDEMQFIQWFLLTSTDKTPYISGLIITIGFLIMCIIISIKCKNATERLETIVLNRRTVITTVILLVLSIMSLSNISTYIYTNF